ncbi:lipid-A-disaccharide synthase N-terminal domain-containing protein [Bacteroides caecigallinarum]|uniref:lipid-A-disaccharide synthase N-terminal domain-containing protein n=1 Tax=Bacteroides caecigallinarum TaxID=1411144 RepID=UPI00195DCF9D|nr:lipid-A-disaccharide synthase N-terminal domain-containing protein [Bacteroides caecigallinarum]MBM6881793.1 lipid-A-disaccharide synthase N-terminal domain-containing protein [Bacteroides caecigallinarum]MBM6890637.1 lipid-A-disaccharide synthase N-terminal domain-containing protein [Bacteroides caecigallinarum]MCF2552649.1 lipid-A-disaccharide synthase N-terminal domain-containing protein [Bacteroides caecigallinarum]
MTIVYIIGFLAQIFFSARILVQWILSERAKEIVSPSIFWILSIAGSYLLFIYGWCRDDFSIILGQIISYYIYIWNLNEKGIWRNVNILLRIILFITPLVACAFLLKSPEQFISQFFKNEDIPIWLLIFGSAGQVIFTLRFIYQLIYSYRKHESKLPIGFWIISLVGSSIIVSYGIFRLDPVLILGQSVGFIAYIRNIILGVRKNKSAKL